MNPVLRYNPDMPNNNWRASITYPLGKDRYQSWEIDRLFVSQENAILMDMFDRVAFESEFYFVCLRF